MPSAPDFLSAEARQEWDRLAPELWRKGLLTALDHAVFEAYCASFGRWQQAMRCMNNLTTPAETKVMRKIASRAWKDCTKYAAQFFFAPSPIRAAQDDADDPPDAAK
jgi:P27 family predicted phage terminase small subunit